MGLQSIQGVCKRKSLKGIIKSTNYSGSRPSSVFFTNDSFIKSITWPVLENIWGWDSLMVRVTRIFAKRFDPNLQILPQINK